MGRLEIKRGLRCKDAIKLWYDFCKENLQDFCIIFKSDEEVNFFINMYFPEFNDNYIVWYKTICQRKGYSDLIYDLNSNITREEWIDMTVIEIMIFLYGYNTKYHLLGRAVEEKIFDKLFENKKNKSINEYISHNKYISQDDAIVILEGIKEYIESIYEV